ncbi:serine hydrolase [Solitalea longa]|uniref:Serine hydrolase n=1 Tax=Solitalea longa TaxID=2079460 RepID=A0A2S5A7I7_9SPHI|nr:serine hydrolase [Solitalea longa]POY38550.1 serine hydrolase [Solitalea longa]
MIRKFILFICLFFISFAFSCSKSNPEPFINSNNSYFPPINSDNWETETPKSLGWDEIKLNKAINYAQSVNTYGLLIIHKGRIVTENYWNGWNKDTKYYIASAGKSVTGYLTGIAQQEGLLNINDKTSKYLGTGWTSLPEAKENLITIKHQLSMTTGLDDGVADVDCTDPSCLIYKADAGKRWAYHNAPYHLLQNVIANASGTTMNNFTKTRLSDVIGMKGSTWVNYILWLNTRDMARFGLLILNKGKWADKTLMTDQNYFNAMVNTSNTYNPSYGYLWWLNGKNSFMVPTLQTVFPGSLVPSAPADMFSALGKGDKKIYIVPSLDLVVVRHGDDTGTNLLGTSSFDEQFWAKLKLAIKY